MRNCIVLHGSPLDYCPLQNLTFLQLRFFLTCLRSFCHFALDISHKKIFETLPENEATFGFLGTCDGGIFTYEKTTGHFLRTAQQEPLTLDTQSPGITLECSNLCSGLGSDCPSFSVDYGGQRCFKMDRNTQGRGDTLAPRDGANYYEKICLRGEISACRDKVWAFERVPGFELAGHDHKEYRNVPSRRDCEEYCLRERGFSCRSAEYNSVSLSCILSRETRRTKPEDFRVARNVDYLENGCISSSKFDLEKMINYSVKKFKIGK